MTTFQKKGYGVHIDYFGSDLGDIPKSKQGDDEIVLAAAKRSGRFSSFEMTGQLMATLKRLEAAGHFKIDTESASYPWTLLVFPPRPTHRE